MKRLITVLLALTLLVSAFMLPEAAVAEEDKIFTLSGAATNEPMDPYLTPRTTYRLKVYYTVQVKYNSKVTYARVKINNKSNFTITKVKTTLKFYSKSNYKGYKCAKTYAWSKTVKAGKTGYTSWKKIYSSWMSAKISCMKWYGARRWWKFY